MEEEKLIMELQDNTEVYEAQLEQQKELLLSCIHEENAKLYLNMRAAVVEELREQNEKLNFKLDYLMARARTIFGVTTISVMLTAISVAGILALVLSGFSNL